MTLACLFAAFNGRPSHHTWAERYPGRLAQPYSAQQTFHRFQAAFRPRCIRYPGRGCRTPELPAPVPAAVDPSLLLRLLAAPTALQALAQPHGRPPHPSLPVPDCGCLRGCVPALAAAHSGPVLVQGQDHDGPSLMARPAVPPAPRNTLRRSALAHLQGKEALMHSAQSLKRAPTAPHAKVAVCVNLSITSVRKGLKY